ncbi:cell division protein SepF [Micromonospora chersina]
MTVKEILLASGSALLVFMSGVVVNLLAKETETLLGAFPVLLLRIARRRVPHGVRDDLYEEWLAELAEALHGTAERPLTRLWLGLRFASGLLKSAGEVGHTLRTVRSQSSVASAQPEPVPAVADLPLHDPRIAAAFRHATVFRPTTYRDAREIGQMFRDGSRVVIDLRTMEEGDARRLVDFSAGLCFGSRGWIDRLTSRVFLLNPGNAEPEEPLLSA